MPEQDATQASALGDGTKVIQSHTCNSQIQDQRTVISVPEEWFQVTTTIRPKAISDIAPIDCHVNLKTLIRRRCLTCLLDFYLFIPVVQTFQLVVNPIFFSLFTEVFAHPSRSSQASDDKKKRVLANFA